MKHISSLGLPLIVLASAALGAHSLAAAPVYVGTCGPANGTHYMTIQQAVSAAPAGSTVLVCPGNYPEQVTIRKNLSLIGIPSGKADSAVITSPAAGVLPNTFDLYQFPTNPVSAQVLVQNAQNVNISNIAVDGGNNLIAGCTPDFIGIYYQNASGSLYGVATRNQTLSTGLTGCQSGEAIFVQSGYGSTGPANVSIRNSSVHTFQKNGITGDGSATTLNILDNDISGQGPTNGAAENGVQISDGAAAKVVGNTVTDDIWAPDMYPDTGNAASGILIYASQGVTISNNTVATTQFGIVTVSDTNSASSNNPSGLADHTKITGNHVINTQIFDAIDVCSNNNSISENEIANATEAGIHLDSTCGGTGVNNSVTENVINESCAGLLVGATPNHIDENVFFNVVNTSLAGDSCLVTPSATTAVATSNLLAAPSGNTHPAPVR